MLYYIAAVFFAVWLALKFVMHRGGFIHTLLLVAIGCFAVQFVQHVRTKQYERDRSRS